VRVIAGSLRGRSLLSPPDGVRPTSDRVRESLFARLGDVSECRVLDLYAGTGALGIEALSRGAEHLVAVDRSARSLKTLKRNVAQLDLAEQVEIVHSDARGALRRLAARGPCFELAFLDPPYDTGDLAEGLQGLVEAGVMVGGGVVVVESAKRHPVAPVEGLVLEDERIYGDTVVSWWLRSEAAGPEADVGETLEQGKRET